MVKKWISVGLAVVVMGASAMSLTACGGDSFSKDDIKSMFGSSFESYRYFDKVKWKKSGDAVECDAKITLRNGDSRTMEDYDITFKFLKFNFDDEDEDEDCICIEVFLEDALMDETVLLEYDDVDDLLDCIFDNEVFVYCTTDYMCLEELSDIYYWYLS